ncbi:MAG: LytTR family transcriptional regulator DNA-binding domain-containing protein [Erysipelotrichaceae bacterium]|nr:LytTR family transcriptional regulator DNA-binding domain-containing protein [Erysipelotrichaceae bacterium]
MKILLYDQRQCYLNLIINKLKHYFSDTICIIICDNLQKFRFYDKYLLAIAIISDDGENIDLLRLFMTTHTESQIIFIWDSYLYVHEMIELGVSDYFIMPVEVDILCESVEKVVVLNTQCILPVKDTKRKHVFMLDDIQYVETNYDDFTITTKDNESFKTSIKNYYFLKCLFKRIFYQVDQSVLINLRFIDYLKNYNIILKTDINYRLSKDYCTIEKERKMLKYSYVSQKK